MTDIKDIDKFLEELAWVIHSPYLQNVIRELRIDREHREGRILLEDGTIIHLLWEGEK